jgi:endonuclease/exonuclease/phosphatase family metal-dependent hydrolase
MPTLTLASWNVEWMNDWFVSDTSGPAQFKASFRDRDHPQYTNDPLVAARRVATVIRTINPDVLAIQEGPSRLAELELFVQRFLADSNGVARYRAFLGDTGDSQKVGLLCKATLGATRVAAADLGPLIAPWPADVDGDARLDPTNYSFTRSPLVVDLACAGASLRVIVLHTKSNFINDGQAMWNDPAQQPEFIKTALRNRRRISTEAMRARRYCDALIALDPMRRVLVMGDLNDGPGTDYFEQNYLAHNCLDILVGSAFEPETNFNAALHDVPVATRYTAVFDDYVEGVANKHLLLDHVLLSPAFEHGPLRRIKNSGRVRHAEYDAQVVQADGGRDQRPSDHRPVSVRLRY